MMKETREKRKIHLLISIENNKKYTPNFGCFGKISHY